MWAKDSLVEYYKHVGLTHRADTPDPKRKCIWKKTPKPAPINTEQRFWAESWQWYLESQWQGKSRRTR